MANSILLDDLVALNDEIAGLVRAGVPLDMGLAGWGRDLPGRLGRTASRLSEAISRGQSLGESLAAERDQIPPIYAAIVTAGLKSGRLPAALESLARTARNLNEVRGAIGLAVLYPLVLLILGYFLFLFLAVRLIPDLITVYEIAPPKFWTVMIRLGDAVLPWAWLPPLVLVVSALVWWLRTRRAIVVGAGSASRWLCWTPVAGRVVRNARAASLAEIMGLLVEHDVPLHEALVLSAQCTADRRLEKSAAQLSALMEHGGAPQEAWRKLDDFPPLLAWLISSGGRKQTIDAMARHIADTYRRRIVSDSNWLRDYLPIWLTLGVGGMVAIAYTTSFIAPFAQLLEALSTINGHNMRIKP